MESHADTAEVSHDVATDAAVRRQRKSHHREAARMKKKINILDVPWEKPKTETAVKYMVSSAVVSSVQKCFTMDVMQDYVQPRKGGKGGSMFDFRTTSTGRFW